MPTSRWGNALEELRRDNRSGAQEIADKALHALIDEIGDSRPTGALSYRQWLVRTCRELTATQPSMGVLLRLVSDMLWATDKAMNAADVRQSALDHLQGVQARQAMALLLLVEAAESHIQDYGEIMTYSRSSTVVRALTALADHSPAPRVWVGEGRPMYEGQTLANELGWAGIRAVLGIDMSLFSWLDRVDALVLGADSVGRTGLVNKVGTAALVHAAAEAGIPRLVLATTVKFMPNDWLASQHLHSGEPEEIMPLSNSNIDVRNPYFDVTPLDEITGVICEHGLLQGDALATALQEVRTYPGLRRLAREE